MKKYLLVIILMTAIGFDTIADTEKEIKAGIKHVTVYPDRAQINHDANIEIPAGKSVLKLVGLSPFIDAQSIQVKGYGDFIILSVNLQNNYLQNLEDQPEVKNIRNQIVALQLKVEDEKAALNVLEEKRAFLIANRAILVKRPPSPLISLKM